MMDFTNGMGFDLVLELNSQSDRREVLGVCGVLATWVVMSDEETNL